MRASAPGGPFVAPFTDGFDRPPHNPVRGLCARRGAR
jgi:hypothetical protein